MESHERLQPDSAEKGERRNHGRFQQLPHGSGSPILSYEDIPKLQELVRTLRKAGAFANKSCGIHIHVGAERFTAKTLRNLVNIMASKEDMIYRALQINPSREHRYCRKTNTRFLKELNRKKPDTLSGIADLWYQEDPYDEIITTTAPATTD